MGRTILCPHCKSTINEDILKQKNSENICLVCGGKLDDNSVDGLKKSKWYYYKEVLPNSPLLSNKTVPKVQCPYCFSTEVQLVPKKFSLFTGIMTNGFNRVCVRCQRKF